MASTRKKQDEKNMRTLRELASFQHNRYCFDCNQRGPTYVNVTIGSFVCTKCSGILRGLTPPHRVKSISMATFTVEEVEFLKNRGNNYCRRSWLGLYDGNVVDTPDEQAVRDFMIDKYERKRYYIEAPVDAQPTLQSKVNTTPAQSSTIQNRPTEFVPRQNKKVSEFLADFSNADIYNAAYNTTKDANTVDNNKPCVNINSAQGKGTTLNNNNVSESSWNFPSFNASFSQIPTVPNINYNNPQGASILPPATETSLPVFSAPSEDRYAALKDLDSVFKSQPQLDWNLGSNSSSSQSSSLYSSPSEHGSSYGSSQLFSQEVTKISNPFNTKVQWGDEVVQQQTNANPFRTTETNYKVNGITNSFYKQPGSFPSNIGNVWTPNPFAPNHTNSSNPFL